MRERRDAPRVLMVIERYWPAFGGTERQLTLLAGALEAEGARVEIVTPRYLPTLPSHEMLYGRPVHRLSYPRVRYLATLGTLVHLAWFLLRRGHGFDVVHAHTIGPLAVVATLVGRLLGKRVVLKAVGWWEFSEGVLNPARRRRPMIRLALAILRHADAWVAVSRALEGAMLDAGIPRARVRRIPNGVDTTRFSPGDRDESRARLRMDPDRPRAVWVGRLDRIKAVPVLLAAWRRVVEKVPDAHLDLVGGDNADATPPNRPGLERLADELGIRDSVTFHGIHDDVVPYLRAANCLVLPSEVEGLSNTLLEAMATGLPAVATRVSGSEDVVSDHANGLLVTPGDEDELARALAAVLMDARAAAEMGVSARGTIERHYAIERVAEAYLGLYRREEPS